MGGAPDRPLALLLSGRGMMTKKILLVDDSSTQRLASRMLFSNRPNYVLISACDGKEGVEAAIREHPDLILMDVEMPRMNGFEACKLIKQNPATRHIPIILLTTRGEEHNIQQGYASGCSDFLVKPVHQEKLTAAIKKHVGG